MQLKNNGFKLIFTIVMIIELKILFVTTKNILYIHST
jgi:hypothetical protein